jgi:hypothetical protein
MMAGSGWEGTGLRWRRQTSYRRGPGWFLPGEIQGGVGLPRPGTAAMPMAHLAAPPCRDGDFPYAIAEERIRMSREEPGRVHHSDSWPPVPGVLVSSGGAEPPGPGLWPGATTLLEIKGAAS